MSMQRYTLCNLNERYTGDVAETAFKWLIKVKKIKFTSDKCKLAVHN